MWDRNGIGVAGPREKVNDWNEVSEQLMHVCQEIRASRGQPR